MTLPNTAVVWLKRDLRSYDHEPLSLGAQHKQCIVLYIIEPQWLVQPEFHPTHLAFVLESLEVLRANGIPVLVRHGDAIEVFEQLQREVPFEALLSHRETGAFWTYQRDLEVAGWCKQQGVLWQEVDQTGVVRGLKDRDGWSRQWEARMARPLHPRVTSIPAPPGLAVQAIPTLAEVGLSTPGFTVQRGGEIKAWEVLRSFLETRGVGYATGLSSPVSAPTDCSRISPYLAYGNLSMKAIVQFTRTTLDHAREVQADPAWKRSLAAFLGRLHWHCHFMQKLESEPKIEFNNFVRSVDGLRSGDLEPPDTQTLDRLHAWQEARTGYPMIDACMRYLQEHRWINFRMRAMLVSFASYHLWIHWRQSGMVLAQRFLDFEPGIHWSQMQMQSGTTGINTVRIYSPAKQALDHDPTGAFVAKWAPEYSTGQGPAPIVDHTSAVQLAKQRIYARRKGAASFAEAQQVTELHGSRRRPRAKR
jgi:deoxyribodipyrimidine photo-lyase